MRQMRRLSDRSANPQRGLLPPTSVRPECAPLLPIALTALPSAMGRISTNAP
jgi:hypothetical protein